MRVMVLVKANAESESGKLPSGDELATMGKFNEDLVKAGVMLAGDGLWSSAEGKRVRFEESGTTVLDGPFAETKELVAGYWIWEVASMEEAVEWLRRAPFESTEVEIRRVFEAEDFAPNMTPEQIAADNRLRDEVAARQQ